MPTDQMKQHRAGGAVRIVLHSANEGVDEKAEVTVSLNNPDVAVERMIETLAQRFPPESVMTIQPTRGLLSGESSSGATNTSSHYSSTSSHRQTFSMAPHIRSGLSRLPPELTSCILANDPSYLPALLGLAVSGDDPRRWAAENNFNPETAASLVHHLASNPEFYDWVTKLAQATTSRGSTPQHRSGEKSRSKKTSRTEKSAHRQSSSKGRRSNQDGRNASGGSGIEDGVDTKKGWTPISGDSHHGLPAGYRIRSDGIVIDPSGQPIFSLSPDGRLIGLDGKPLRADQGTLVVPGDASVDSRSGYKPALYRPDGVSPTGASGSTSPGEHVRSETRGGMTSPGTQRLPSDSAGRIMPRELVPGFGEYVETLSDGTRVRYVEVEVVEEKLIEIPTYEKREVERIVKVPEVREIEKLEYYPDIEWTERKVSVETAETVTKEVTVHKVVEVPREVVTEKVVVVKTVREEVVEIPRTMEVEKPYDVENRVTIPRYCNQEQQTVVAQKLRPVVRESGKTKHVKTKTYEPVLYAVDIYVPKAISNVIESRGKIGDTHRIVEIPAPQYNTLLDKMNRGCELEDLYVRDPKGQVPLLPTSELAEIVPPMPGAFATVTNRAVETDTAPVKKSRHHRQTSRRHRHHKKSHHRLSARA